MIIHRAFYREATKTALAITIVLLVIFLFISLTALLGRVVHGDESSALVLPLLALQTLRRLDQLLPLSIYLGALLTLSRWYRDSEMSALAACGIGLPQLLRPVLMLALAAALIVGVFAFYLSPLAIRLSDKARQENAARPEINLIVPGVFTQSPDSDRILYAEKADPQTGALDTVFVSSAPTQRGGVVIARQGTQVTDPGTDRKFLALRNGAIYDGSPGQTDYRVLEFDTLLMRLKPKKVAETSLSESALPTLALLRAPPTVSVLAELHWRLARPLSAFVLTFFALVLAYTDVRRGRLSNLFAAVFVYFIYSNLIALGDALVHKGKMPALVGLWWVHAAVALLAAYLLWRRSANKPLFALPRGEGGR